MRTHRNTDSYSKSVFINKLSNIFLKLFGYGFKDISNFACSLSLQRSQLSFSSVTASASRASTLNASNPLSILLSAIRIGLCPAVFLIFGSSLTGGKAARYPCSDSSTRSNENRARSSPRLPAVPQKQKTPQKS